MRFKKVAKIFFVTMALSLMWRAGQLQWSEWNNTRLTKDLCSLVAVHLEASNLLETYEGLNGGLRHSGFTNACVNVIDNGRSFSPDCIEPDLQYQVTTCKAEANTGVRATILYAKEDFLGWPLFFLFVGLFASFIILSELLNLLSKIVMDRFANEIKLLLDLDSANKTNSNLIARLVNWFLTESGIAEKVTNQADNFRRQLLEYETMVAKEASAKNKRLHETQAAQKYIERVRSIRHDIRSPLSSLQAVREAISADPESERTLFSAIRRIQVMLDQLEDVDRVAEKETLVIAEVAADDLIFELKAKFEQAKGVNVSYKFDHSQLSPILVGREGFNKVLDNLLQNAFDAVGKNGQIELSVSSDNSCCHILVEDNGSGIPVDAESKIFGLGETFGKLNGIGLGLFHTKKNVESWGGQICFERLQVGTRFVVKIPLAQTGVQFVGLDPGQKFKVIDDDHTVPKALKNSGYEVTEIAETFAKGQSLLASHRSKDCTVLVDYRLDDGNLGTDLIDQHPGRQGILLCTNDYDDNDLIKKAKILGVKIVPKPICYSGQLSFT